MMREIAGSALAPMRDGAAVEVFMDRKLADF
jgi:hypothetical protein